MTSRRWNVVFSVWLIVLGIGLTLLLTVIIHGAMQHQQARPRCRPGYVEVNAPNGFACVPGYREGQL